MQRLQPRSCWLLKRRWVDGQRCQYGIVSREAGGRVEYRRQKSCMAVRVGCCVGQGTRRSLPESLRFFVRLAGACLPPVFLRRASATAALLAKSPTKLL